LLSIVYGPHIPGEKVAFLHNIGKLKNICLDELWIIGGDFNLISLVEEKNGGITR